MYIWNFKTELYCLQTCPTFIILCLDSWLLCPSWCLSQKFWWLFFFILLFLRHMTSNPSEHLVGAIFKIYIESDHQSLLLWQLWSQLAASRFLSLRFIMNILKHTTKLQEFYTNTYSQHLDSTLNVLPPLPYHLLASTHPSAHPFCNNLLTSFLVPCFVPNISIQVIILKRKSNRVSPLLKTLIQLPISLLLTL